MTERYWLAGGEKALPSMTLPGLRFAADQSRLLEFLLFWTESKLMCAPLHARELGERGQSMPLPEPRAPVSDPSIVFWPSPRTKFDYEAHEPLIEEMVVTRVVDNLLSYLSELLALIYKTRPAMLKSSEPETLEFILQFADMDELRSALAEKRVERLAYLGLRSLSEYLEKQTDFSLLPKRSDLDRAALLVEFRNVIVHNRAVIGNPTVRRFPMLRDMLGKRLRFRFDELRDHRQFIENAVLDIDVRATAKFDLAAARLPEHPREPPDAKA